MPAEAKTPADPSKEPKSDKTPAASNATKAQKGKGKKSAKKEAQEQMAKTTKAGFGANLEEGSNLSVAMNLTIGAKKGNLKHRGTLRKLGKKADESKMSTFQVGET